MENTLVKAAQERNYTEFSSDTKEILAQKVANKLKEQGYFDQLNQAQAKEVNEAEETYKD